MLGGSTESTVISGPEIRGGRGEKQGKKFLLKVSLKNSQEGGFASRKRFFESRTDQGGIRFWCRALKRLNKPDVRPEKLSR